MPAVHEDERRMRQLKKFYFIYNPAFVDTCEEHIAGLKRQCKSNFSWDFGWLQQERR